MQSPDSFLSLLGKIAVIIVASRAIGASIALELATQDANVLVTYTSASSTDQVRGLIGKVKDLENGSHAIAVRADLRNLSGADLIARLPSLEDQINDPGVDLVKYHGSITLKDFELVYNLNVRGTLLMTQAVLPHLPVAGRIINISSVGARCDLPGLSVYCSSEAAIEGLTRCWAAELGKNGTIVNCVNPGAVQTLLVENIAKNMVEQQKANTPIEKRIGIVNDIAKLLLGWLAKIVHGSRVR